MGNTSMSMQAKVVVITGASMGIGEAIAALFARENATVVLLSREQARAEAARQRLGPPVNSLALACDVREETQVRATVETVRQRFGRIDLWINNAGHGLLDSVATMDLAACRGMFETNLFGAVICMQAVFPVMKAQGGGTIVNISSVAGHIAVPYMAAYSATKHALNALGKAARLEMSPHHVHVMTVCPGYIRTNFSVNAVKGAEIRRFGERVRRGITPDRVARAVLTGYLRRKREVVVPASDWLKVKLYQLWPGLIEAFMARMLRETTPDKIAAAEAARRQQP